MAELRFRERPGPWDGAQRGLEEGGTDVEKAVRVAALGDDDAGEAGGSNVNFSLSSSFLVVNSARLVLRK